MKVERSPIPGYQATVVQLAPHEQFVMRNPQDREDVIAVSTVVAFDPPRGAAGPAPAAERRPYFTVEGTHLGDGTHRQFDDPPLRDFGALPPHVRDAVIRAARPEYRDMFEPVDHRVLDANERLAQAQRRHPSGKALPPGHPGLAIVADRGRTR